MSDETGDDGDEPDGKPVTCPSCDRTAYAIVPSDSRIVEHDADADGKVWVTCLDCGDRFIARYRARSVDR